MTDMGSCERARVYNANNKGLQQLYNARVPFPTRSSSTRRHSPASKFQPVSTSTCPFPFKLPPSPQPRHSRCLHLPHDSANVLSRIDSGDTNNSSPMENHFQSFCFHHLSSLLSYIGKIISSLTILDRTTPTYSNSVLAIEYHSMLN